MVILSGPTAVEFLLSFMALATMEGLNGFRLLSNLCTEWIFRSSFRVTGLQLWGMTLVNCLFRRLAMDRGLVSVLGPNFIG